jgi:hypothetical protein
MDGKTNGSAIDNGGTSTSADQKESMSTSINHQRQRQRQDQRQQCEECKIKDAIYQCPCCSIRSCSLQCCVCHKERTGCSGKRNRGAFLPLSGMSDKTLRSDYFFLEEVLEQIPRASKIAKKMDTDTNGNSTKTSKKHAAMNKKCRRLVQQAEQRNVTLQTMPPIMERHQKNTSWYCGPRDMITWKVEVIFHPSQQTVSFNLSENEENILEHIMKHLQPSEGSTDNNYKLFIKRPGPANKPRYIEMKPDECLRKVLEGLTIIEHPTIYCVPKDDTTLKQFPVGTESILEDKTMPSSPPVIMGDSKDAPPTNLDIQ